jgi:hypothetical protein
MSYIRSCKILLQMFSRLCHPLFIIMHAAAIGFTWARYHFFTFFKFSMAFHFWCIWYSLKVSGDGSMTPVGG